MASILKGQSGQPIQFETKPNVNGDDVATESAVSAPNNALIKSALNAGGDAPVYACRAWVNFNGTGTVAIRASGNVSSISDNGTGEYTVNFATVMPDADYYINSTPAGAGGVAKPSSAFITASSVRIFCYNFTGSSVDSDYIFVHVGR